MNDRIFVSSWFPCVRSGAPLKLLITIASYNVYNYQKCVITGLPLDLWFQSHITCRTQMVVFGDSRTPLVWVKFGVQQGSILGPILNVLSTLLIFLPFSLSISFRRGSPLCQLCP